MKDTSRGIEKAQLGRHMGDRSHVVTRSRNHHTGDMDENQELHNLDDGELSGVTQVHRLPSGREFTPGLISIHVQQQSLLIGKLFL